MVLSFFSFFLSTRFFCMYFFLRIRHTTIVPHFIYIIFIFFTFVLHFLFPNQFCRDMQGGISDVGSRSQSILVIYFYS